VGRNGRLTADEFTTVIVKVFADDIAGVQESVTEIVNVLVTAPARTVPLMTPVVGLRLKPAGSAPETSRHPQGWKSLRNGRFWLEIPNG
jgi:hypothetical protein